MSTPDESRLSTELELMEAMYPSQVTYDSKSREFKFTDGSSLLQLRLPQSYPESGLPDVISASDASKNDVRNKTKAEVQALGLTNGEEALDAVVACFLQILEQTKGTNDAAIDSSNAGFTGTSAEPEAPKTVIIWLHHLLALTKRKLAISPSSTSVSGITKPGYPGVMVFTGLCSAVNEHVNTLKAENWQAFQVRYEADERWEFAHGAEVREVESMAEVVKHIEAGGGGKQRKEEFLKAVGIK